ncbi:hypothetical protein IJH89_00910 [Candidatus Saccharibacteria bacterium]|nr:hypothetical protein [Candidatus Saccharibacteria bacterium]
MTKEDDENVALTNRINADLREKVARTQGLTDEPDLEDADYLQEYEKTGRFSWVWFVLIGLAIASLVFIVLL